MKGPHVVIDQILGEMERERNDPDPVVGLLGSIFAKDCVLHAVIPTMLSSIYAPWPNEPGYTMPVGRSRRDTSLTCFKCNQLRPDERMQLGLRIGISKSALIDNNWNYGFGCDWVLICIGCCGAKSLMDISRPQLDALENWLDGIAGEYCCEILSEDVTALELWRQVRSRFDADYFELMKKLGSIRKACAHCNKAHAKKYCSACYIHRYCDAECSKSHWPHHKSTCGFIKLRTSVFEKEASYKILLNK
jgi:hypothetical protein